MLGTAAVASAASFLLAGRLNHAYIESLERSLTHHALDLDLSDAEDAATPYVGPVTAGLPITRGLPLQMEAHSSPPGMCESVARQWVELSSGNSERIRNALRTGPPLERPLLPYVIPMLARKSLASDARKALKTSC